MQFGRSNVEVPALFFLKLGFKYINMFRIIDRRFYLSTKNVMLFHSTFCFQNGIIDN